MGASRKGASTLKLRYIMNIGVLSSISIVLMLFNFPLPPFPNFLQVDFSDVPALLAAMTMGPVAGILVELLKNMLDWLLSGSITGVPVGHIANFTTGVLFIIPVTFFYSKLQRIKGLIIGLVAGTIVMAVGMSLLNYVLFLPMYTLFLGMEPVKGDALKDMIVLGILPFNLVKGVIVMIVTMLVCRNIGTWMSHQRTKYN
ncbi:ECF transporter S component [Lysinibacillus parviboronicapiens]|uniref:ECF transporter S component n=1 Tax=Lysinibacillus parviboronicapiens TaxID=436516 RepID=UPI000D3704FF|nr:ECF transporter S component [Lysinibacillus parviboronicapiens]